MRRALRAVLVRDLRTAFRRKGEVLFALAFALIAASLFPIAVGPAHSAAIGVGAIWTISLFALTLGMERLFLEDEETGALALFLGSPAPLELLALARCSTHWLRSGLPLALLSPALALMFGLEGAAFWALPLSLLIGGPTLTLIGAVAAALLIGARKGGGLIALIALPLQIPTLIFGVGAAQGAIGGLGGAQAFLFSGALLALALAGAPFAIAAALRAANG